MQFLDLVKKKALTEKIVECYDLPLRTKEVLSSGSSGAIKALNLEPMRALTSYQIPRCRSIFALRAASRDLRDTLQDIFKPRLTFALTSAIQGGNPPRAEDSLSSYDALKIKSLLHLRADPASPIQPQEPARPRFSKVLIISKSPLQCAQMCSSPMFPRFSKVLSNVLKCASRRQDVLQLLDESGAPLQQAKDLGSASRRLAPVGRCDDTSAGVAEVIQEIKHSEPAAVRDEEAAALMVRAQIEDDFAMIVERHLQDPEVEPTQPSNKVHIISFRSGKGELFRNMLLQDEEFEPLRNNLQNAGFPLVLKPSNVIVLVRPDQYLDTVHSLEHRSLKRYNVAIAESEEYLLDEVLQRMRSKERPRENRADREELDLDPKFVYKRTFLCKAPKLLVAGTVAQSTTEAPGQAQLRVQATWPMPVVKILADALLGLGAIEVWSLCDGACGNCKVVLKVALKWHVLGFRVVAVGETRAVPTLSSVTYIFVIVIHVWRAGSCVHH